MEDVKQDETLFTVFVKVNCKQQNYMKMAILLFHIMLNVLQHPILLLCYYYMPDIKIDSGVARFLNF